jgi:hypothetical protein
MTSINSRKAKSRVEREQKKGIPEGFPPARRAQCERGSSVARDTSCPRTSAYLRFSDDNEDLRSTIRQKKITADYAKRYGFDIGA